MTFCMLIPGSSLPFLWRLAPGLLLLALLLSGLSVLLLAARAKQIVLRQSIQQEPIMPPPLPLMAMLPTAESVRKISKTVFLLCVGVLVGRLWMDHELTANRYHYEDVLVSRHSDISFTLQPTRMQPFDMTTCTPQNWQTGEKMRFIHFQWSPECDNVGERGAFEFYSEHGQRLLYPQEILNVREEAAR